MMNSLSGLQAFLYANGIYHFSAKEIAPVGKLANGVGPALILPPEAKWPNIVPTLKIMEELRAALGVPLFVHSCYRDPAYNRAIGGERYSLHIAFNAVDFSPAFDLPGDDDLAFIYEYLDHHHDADKCGIGIYRSFIHFDTRKIALGRKAPARWDER